MFSMICGAICLVAALTPAKTQWPDIQTETLQFIANPVEANMPGHWVPLSIVKKILAGDPTVSITKVVSRLKTITKRITNEIPMSKRTTTPKPTTTTTTAPPTIPPSTESTPHTTTATTTTTESPTKEEETTTTTESPTTEEETTTTESPTTEEETTTVIPKNTHKKKSLTHTKTPAFINVRGF